MIRLLVFFALAIAVALIAVYFAENPGSVSFEWLGIQVQTSVGVAFLGLIVFGIVFTVAFEVLRHLQVLPRRIIELRSRSRELQGYRAMTDGLIAAAAGDAKTAKTLAQTASKLLPNDRGLLLLEAQACQLNGDEETAHLRFRQMMDNRRTEFLGARGLIAQAIKDNDRQEALELARRAYRANPETPWAVTTLFELLTEHEHWDEAVSVVDQMHSLKIVDASVARRHRAALETLVARQKLQAKELGEARRAARRAFGTMPSFSPAAIAIVDVTRELGAIGEGRTTIERAWQVAPHPDLARAYAQLRPNETPKERLKRFGVLERRNPAANETLLTMAELALAAGDHKLARGYLTRALGRDETARACRLMAEIERASGSPAAKVDEWLAKADDARPDMAWVCEETGEILPQWVPFGSNGQFNGVTWTTPPTLALLSGAPPQPTFVIGHDGGGHETSTAKTATKAGPTIVDHVNEPAPNTSAGTATAA